MLLLGHRCKMGIEDMNAYDKDELNKATLTVHDMNSHVTGLNPFSPEANTSSNFFSYSEVSNSNHKF